MSANTDEDDEVCIWLESYSGLSNDRNVTCSKVNISSKVLNTTDQTSTASMDVEDSNGQSASFSIHYAGMDGDGKLQHIITVIPNQSACKMTSYDTCTDLSVTVPTNGGPYEISC